MPGLRDWIFSVKTYVSAMLALYIGFSMNLDRPYWAMATAYMVAQPLTGAMRSKAVYRFCGTLLGSIAAVVLVPNLASSPELLSLALSLWVGLCLYFAMLDRTPRSYVFMLAGYTGAIVGFPSVTAPGQIFETALVRVEEITLGIVCATVIGTVVLPRPLGPALLKRIDTWFGYARDWSVAVLSGNADADEIKAARRLLAATSVEIAMLSSHLAYDTSYLQSVTRPLTLLRGRIVALLPVLGALADWRAELAANGGVPAELQDLMERIGHWIAHGRLEPLAAGEALRAEVARIHEAQAPPVTWREIVLAAVLSRLDDLTAIVHDARALRRHVDAGDSDLPPLLYPADRAPDTTRWHDRGMALLSSFAAVVAVGLICLVWIVTAWPDGATGAMMAAVLCSFFATLDDPAPAIMSFQFFTVVGIGIDFVYLFAILPQVTSFAGVALVMAPTYIVTGAFIAVPATMLAALSTAVNGSSLLALTDTYHASFAGFVNTGLATVVGGSTAAVVTKLVRSVGAEWSARRLRRATWTAIAVAASQPDEPYRPAMLATMLDRLAELVPRLAAVDPHADASVTQALTDVRIGLSVATLRASGDQLPGAARPAIAAALDELARHYRRSQATPAGEALRTDIDQAITILSGSALGAPQDAFLSLVAIRHSLFPSLPLAAARV